jgi:hypothetical protein
MSMRLILSTALAALLCSPATSSPYYGPKQGIFGTGYKQSVEKDGSLRIATEYHGRDPDLALNVALYRAAELARSAGKPYVQILGGYASARHGVALGNAYARPTDSPAPPPACRRAKRCYTADVVSMLHALSGPRGNEPGVMKPSGTDQFGRIVTSGGYGAGAVAWLQR